MHRDAFAVGAALALWSAGGALAAQAPEVLRDRPTAMTSGVGGAGVSLVGMAEARFANPALLAADRNVGVGAGASRAELTDVITLRAGFLQAIGDWGHLSLDVRQRRVENLVEDSLLAGDPALQVSDLGLRVGWARRLGGRVRVGAAAERVSSTVFGTDGRGWSADAGVALSVRRLDLGLTMSQLGPSYRWRDASGLETRSDLARSATAGTRWVAVSRDGLETWLTLEHERELGNTGGRTTRAGAQLTVARRLSLRAGALRTRSPDAEAARSYAFGLGLRARGLRLELARDRIGAAVGQRTLIDVSAER